MTGAYEWTNDGLALLLIIAWGVALYRLGRIGYAPSYRLMRRRIEGALGFALAAGALSIAKLAYSAAVSPDVWSLGADNLLLQAALLIAPFAAALALSVPRLWRAAKMQAPDEEAAPDGPARRKVADPAAIVPFQVSAVGAALACYLSYAGSGPIGIGWVDMAAPVPLLILATVLLWRRQRTRRRTLGKFSWTLPAFAVRATRGTLAILIAAAVIMIWARGMGENVMPNRAGQLGAGGWIGANSVAGTK